MHGKEKKTDRIYHLLVKKNSIAIQYDNFCPIYFYRNEIFCYGDNNLRVKVAILYCCAVFNQGSGKFYQSFFFFHVDSPLFEHPSLCTKIMTECTIIVYEYIYSYKAVHREEIRVLRKLGGKNRV